MSKFKIGDEVNYNISGSEKITGIQLCKSGDYRFSLANGLTIDGVYITGSSDPKKDKSEPEPVKLYCVKDCMPGSWLTKGKVYEVVNGEITFDDGYVDTYDDTPICDEGTEIDSLCVPLVKRPAKVGETVYLTCNGGFSFAKEGDVKRVDFVKSAPGAIGILGGQWDHREPLDGDGWTFVPHEYLVLDGYTEPEEPKFYSGKVVCVAVPRSCNWTPGKVYEVKNGQLKDDWGNTQPSTNAVNPRTEPFKSFEDMLSTSMVTWIEFKGE